MTPITPVIQPKCPSCAHFNPIEPGATTGACQESPPHTSVVLVPQVNQLTRQSGLVATGMTQFPQVNEDNWCGRWRGRLSTMQ